MSVMRADARAIGRLPGDRQAQWSKLSPWQRGLVDQMRQMGFGMLRLLWTEGELRYHGEDAIVQDDDLTRAAWEPPSSALNPGGQIDSAFVEFFGRAATRLDGTIFHVRVAQGLPVRVQLTIPLPLR